MQQRWRAGIGVGLVALACALPPLAQAVERPGKLALIVVVADYPEGSGYGKLHADNDRPLIEGALRRQGFRKADIVVLEDAAATREGIVAAIETQLIARAASGDIAFFHYSGHGHRITDDDGDEPDGYDEVLSPHGAPGEFEEGYDGALHLRDDELGVLFEELRARLGPDGSLLVSLDSCYSGSATRGAGELPTRGVITPLGPPAATRGAGTDDGGGFTPAERGASSRDPATLAPFVVFSAASHDEQAHETRDRGQRGRPVVGGLSLALSHALGKAGRGTSYRALFDRVRAEMAASCPRQTPQIEGDVDGLVLRGDVVEQAPYLEVVEVAEDGVVVVRGGFLAGLHEGAVVAFHAPGTADPGAARPRASGTVTGAGEDTARVTVDGVAPKAEKLEESWAFVTQAAFGDLALRVRLDDGLPQGLRDALTADLSDSRVVTLVDGEEDIAVSLADPGQVTLTRVAAGTVVGDPVAPRDTAAAEILVARLRQLASGTYLSQLHLTDPSLQVRLEIVPAEARFDAAGGFQGCAEKPPGANLDTGGQLRFHPGEVYLLRLHHEGREAAWVTVLDIMADGSVEQLYPPAGAVQSDNQLPPGAVHLVHDPCFQVTEPYGTEVIKLFSTREPMRLDTLLGDAYPDGTTRSQALRAPRGAGADYAVTIQVVQED
jgi:metacaspase-1